MAYCSKCGSKIIGNPAFCGECGTDLAEHPPENTFETHRIPAPDINWNKLPWTWIGGGGAVVAVIWLAITVLPGLFDGGDDQAQNPSEPIITTMTEPPDFDSYSDEFLSGPITVTVTSPANARNYPTSRETRITKNLFQGDSLFGRWVRGFEPSTRWFKTVEGSYVWEGNLNVAESGNVLAGAMGFEFPQEIRGKWLDPGACTREKSDAHFLITANSLLIFRNLRERNYTLANIKKNQNGNSEFHLGELDAGDFVVMKMTFQLEDDGRMLQVNGSNTSGMNRITTLLSSKVSCDQFDLQNPQ